jgi:hypothetical protein
MMSKEIIKIKFIKAEKDGNTRGLVKTNWTYVPFIVSFKYFTTLDGCVLTDNDISSITVRNLEGMHGF